MPGSAAATANISTSSLAMSFNNRRVVHALSAAAVALVIAVQPASSQRPAFYPDDPIQIDDDMTLDASKVGRLEDSNGYDFVVNTIDEVPDSSWFANRIGRAKMATADLVRGPDRVESITLEGWKISAPKES